MKKYSQRLDCFFSLLKRHWTGKNVAATFFFKFSKLIKWKFKQWCSTIPPNSTKWTIASHLKSLNIKKTTTYDVGNPCSGWNRFKNVTEVKPVNRISNLPLLIIGSPPTTIQISTKDKTQHQFASTQNSNNLYFDCWYHLKHYYIYNQELNTMDYYGTNDSLN